MANYAYTFASGDTVTPTKLNNARTISEIVNADIKSDAAIAGTKLATTVQQSLVPAGAVMPFAMNSAPSGWLSADGSNVNRTTYSDLFSVIGTTHGSGDGSTTFTLPDLRGIFVRGSGSQTISSVTYNKTFAAKETDALQQHIHTSNKTLDGTSLSNGGTLYDIMAEQGATDATAVTGNVSAAGRTATETRPANIALLYCIKF
jgi:microcystin-dependent protein